VIYVSAVKEVNDILSPDCKNYKFCGADQLGELDNKVEGFDLLNTLLDVAPKTLIEGLTPPNYKDELIYIYTSGTTGLPKAAVLRNSR